MIRLGLYDNVNRLFFNQTTAWLCQSHHTSSIKSLKDDSNYKSVLNLLYAHQVMIQHIDDGYCLEILHT